MADTEPTSGDEKRTILVAMDGSKHSTHAFEWFVANIYRETDTVLMAHCAEYVTSYPPSVMMAANPSVVQAMVREHEDQVMNVLRQIDELAKKYKMPHKLERLHGSPGEAMVKAAESQHVDMIVMGSRGLGVLRRTIMGSISDYVIHHAHIPVLVCKHEDEHLKQSH